MSKYHIVGNHMSQLIYFHKISCTQESITTTPQIWPASSAVTLKIRARSPKPNQVLNSSQMLYPYKFGSDLPSSSWDIYHTKVSPCKNNDPLPFGGGWGGHNHRLLSTWISKYWIALGYLNSRLLVLKAHSKFSLVSEYEKYFLERTNLDCQGLISL